MRPEVFIDGSDFQLGLNTFGRDVTGDYTLDGGVRYSTEDEYWSLRAGFFAKGFSLRYTRYPFSYATVLNQFIDESRREVKAFWRPWDSKAVKLSANYRVFEEKETGENGDDETWAAVHLKDSYGRHGIWMDLEWFFNGSQSLFGGGNLMFGESIYTMVHLQAGKTWGNYSFGHDTYRVGGNVAEGYFTQRPSRLFPLRGFDSNILDSTQAIISGIECFWPLVNIQDGYKTLPLFLHRLMLGTFVDAGIAADPFTHEDILVGGGVELFTSMEVAWGYFSSFQVGVAWPIYQPDYMNEKGPIFLIQIGRPL